MGRGVSASEPRSDGAAALWSRPPLPKRDRQKLDPLDLTGAENGERDHRFPVLSIGGESDRIVLVPAIAEVSRRRFGSEVELGVVLRGEELDRLVLENEVPQAVEDRLPLVQLDPFEDVRPVSNEHVGAGVDRGAGESLQELRRFMAVSRERLVAVNRDPDAPIYQRANIGVVGDYKKVIPAFQKKCEELLK